MFKVIRNMYFGNYRRHSPFKSYILIWIGSALEDVDSKNFLSAQPWWALNFFGKKPTGFKFLISTTVPVFGRKVQSPVTYPVNIGKFRRYVRELRNGGQWILPMVLGYCNKGRALAVTNHLFNHSHRKKYFFLMTMV